jgi:hypothetical protein
LEVFFQNDGANLKVRRQAPSRLREPLKAVMEPAPPPSRPIPGHIAKSKGIIIFVSECILVVKSAGNEIRST